MESIIIKQLFDKLEQSVSGWSMHYSNEPWLPEPNELAQALLRPSKLTNVQVTQLLQHFAMHPALRQWAAYSPSAKTHWDPLRQSYDEFLSLHQDAEPFLLLTPRDPTSLLHRLLGLVHLHDDSSS
ncbi:hypothetical protein [Limnohabitans sp. DM1]|uniref:hypothetical protein n=1 Tax=Limnohabitans sp. DM1 TaxID=1597955 RepID=UPI000A7D5552|nr:hypothetical protein [Limnohabitans sp. DM1]